MHRDFPPTGFVAGNPLGVPRPFLGHQAMYRPRSGTKVPGTKVPGQGQFSEASGMLIRASQSLGRMHSLNQIEWTGWVMNQTPSMNWTKMGLWWVDLQAIWLRMTNQQRNRNVKSPHVNQRTTETQWETQCGRNHPLSQTLRQHQDKLVELEAHLLDTPSLGSWQQYCRILASIKESQSAWSSTCLIYCWFSKKLETSTWSNCWQLKLLTIIIGKWFVIVDLPSIILHPQRWAVAINHQWIIILPTVATIHNQQSLAILHAYVGSSLSDPSEPREVHFADNHEQYILLESGTTTDSSPLFEPAQPILSA